eukprot:TRINITY_DN4164_c2_g2_i4.p2 TRINITY_DN4164_c2_g2~~TRINITY_DN4164_c2_g2_i4.p2  ORF type:complete len:197 (+),score=-27.52 TRINITY_DN4164_c2_g2_i4:368-958(+)
MHTKHVSANAHINLLQRIVYTQMHLQKYIKIYIYVQHARKLPKVCALLSSINILNIQIYIIIFMHKQTFSYTCKQTYTLQKIRTKYIFSLFSNVNSQPQFKIKISPQLKSTQKFYQMHKNKFYLFSSKYFLKSPSIIVRKQFQLVLILQVNYDFKMQIKQTHVQYSLLYLLFTYNLMDITKIINTYKLYPKFQQTI